MTSTRAFDNRLVLSDGTVDPHSGKSAGYICSASPLIIGIVAPVLMLVLIDPLALWYAPFLGPTVLLPLTMFSVAVYTYSVLNPGDVVAVVADPDKRTLELVQANAFATRRTVLSFDEIAAVRLAVEYGQDGYAAERTELQLHNGDRIPLHSIGGRDDYQSLRAALGRRDP